MSTLSSSPCIHSPPTQPLVRPCASHPLPCRPVAVPAHEPTSGPAPVRPCLPLNPPPPGIPWRPTRPTPPRLARPQPDPYFNYRSTIKLVQEGFHEFWNWFDADSWHPLGRVIGGTVYPGLMVTAALLYKISAWLTAWIKLRDICVFTAPFFAGNTVSPMRGRGGGGGGGSAARGWG